MHKWPPIFKQEHKQTTTEETGETVNGVSIFWCNIN